MGEFRMPSLGADMDAGTLIEWHVAPGAQVKKGDIVALVETQKGIVEIEIFESGIVEKLLVSPGAKVPVGTVLATLRSGSAPQATTAAPPPPPPAPTAPAAPTVVAPVHAPSKPNGAPHVLASPAARARARERGVDLAKVAGTGPHGAVTRDDVDRAVEPPPAKAATAPPTSKPAAQAMRDAIAAAMARSKREIPHYYLTQDIDVFRATRWLEELNAGRRVEQRVLFAALLLKATALALRDVPELNGFFRDEAFRPSHAIHLGVAISLRQGGLVAPAIHDTDTLSLSDLMSAMRDLVLRTRAGTLRSSEMSDPTITVTNLGDQGADSVLAVIYPPQVAIVGFGTVRERPWAENGLLGVRPVVTATLAADHRASDGHRGARFLSRVAKLLAEPEKL